MLDYWNIGGLAVGWIALSLINAGLAESYGRRGERWWLASLLLGPVCTLFIMATASVEQAG